MLVHRTRTAVRRVIALRAGIQPNGRREVQKIHSLESYRRGETMKKKNGNSMSASSTWSFTKSYCANDMRRYAVPQHTGASLFYDFDWTVGPYLLTLPCAVPRYLEQQTVNSQT